MFSPGRNVIGYAIRTVPVIGTATNITSVLGFFGLGETDLRRSGQPSSTTHRARRSLPVGVSGALRWITRAS
ncbi:hypothetical protein ACFWJW_03505 [Streptomyces sp. NPDC127097]|uniref:hypothetical protein n=1 Tax=Streptomyces sp. NPDC127097 TaxID=3347136 RepID=UPI0036667E91